MEVFLDCKGLEVLEALEYHTSEDIRSLAKHILEEFIYPEEVSINFSYYMSIPYLFFFLYFLKQLL